MRTEPVLTWEDKYRRLKNAVRRWRNAIAYDEGCDAFTAIKAIVDEDEADQAPRELMEGQGK